MFCGFYISYALLIMLFLFPACSEKTVHNVQPAGSDSSSATERGDDTATQMGVDTTSSCSDSAPSTEADTESFVVSTETESLTDSTPSTDTQLPDTSSDKGTDGQESTDSATILVDSGSNSDGDSSDTLTVDTDGHSDTGTNSNPSTDSDSDTASSSAGSGDTSSITENESDTNSEPDSETVEDTQTEHPQNCEIVGVNDFGDCGRFLGWATVGNHCAPIAGCSCAPYCDRFFETEDACVVECFGLIACGGPLGNTCADDQYCDFKTGEDCGDEGATAICRVRQKGCEAIYWPVCGCDANTYANDCEAGAVGWGYRHEGICNTP